MAINGTQNIEDEEYGEENYVRMYQIKGTYPSRSPNALRYIKDTKINESEKYNIDTDVSMKTQRYLWFQYDIVRTFV